MREERILEYINPRDFRDYLEHYQEIERESVFECLQIWELCRDINFAGFVVTVIGLVSEQIAIEDEQEWSDFVEVKSVDHLNDIRRLRDLFDDDDINFEGIYFFVEFLISFLEEDYDIDLIHEDVLDLEIKGDRFVITILC